MAGGLLQLIAQGVDSLFIIGKPEITLFKTVYRRHSNFSKSETEINFNSILQFGNSNYCLVKHKGDILRKLMLVIELPEISMYYPINKKIDLQRLLEAYDITVSFTDNTANLVVADKTTAIELVQLTISNYTALLTNVNNSITNLQGVSLLVSDYLNQVYYAIRNDNDDEIIYKFLVAYNSDLTSANIIIGSDMNYLLYNAYLPSITTHIPNDIDYGDLNNSINLYNIVNFNTYTYNIVNQSSTDYFKSSLNKIVDRTSPLSTVFNPNVDITELSAYKYIFNYTDTIDTLITNKYDVSIVKHQIMDNIKYNIGRNIQNIDWIYKNFQVDYVLLENNYSSGSFEVQFKIIKYISDSDSYDIYRNWENARDYWPNLFDYPLNSVMSNPIENPPSSVVYTYSDYISNEYNVYNSKLHSIFEDDIKNRLNTQFPSLDRLSDIWNYPDLFIKCHLDEYTASDYDEIYLINTAMLTLPANIVLLYQTDFINDDIFSGISDDIKNNYVVTANLPVPGFASVLDLITDELAHIIYVNLTAIKSLKDMSTQHANDKVFLLINKPNQKIFSIDSSVPNYQTMFTLTEYVISIYYIHLDSYLQGYVDSDTITITQKNNAMSKAYIYLYNFTSNNILSSSNQLATHGLFEIPEETLESLTEHPFSTSLNFDAIFGPVWVRFLGETSIASNSIYNKLFRNYVNRYKSLYENIFNENYIENTIGSEFLEQIQYSNQQIGVVTGSYTNYYYISPSNFPNINNILSSGRNMVSQLNTFINNYDQTHTKLLNVKNMNIPSSLNYSYFTTLLEYTANIITNNPTAYGDSTSIINTINPTLNYNGAMDVVDGCKTQFDYFVSTKPNPYTSSNPARRQLYDDLNIVSLTTADINRLEARYNELISLNSSILSDDIVRIVKYFNSFNTNRDVINYIRGEVAKNSLGYDYLILVGTTNQDTYNNIYLHYNTLKTTYETSLSTLGNGSTLITAINTLHTSETSANFSWISKVGHYIIKRIATRIDDQTIEQHTGEWLNIYHENDLVSGKERGYNIMIGDISNLTTHNTTTKQAYKLFIPLQFWYNRNSTGLPLVSCMHNKVYIDLELENMSTVAKYATDAKFRKKPRLNGFLISELLYVDVDERMKLAHEKQEHLVDLVVHNGYKYMGKNDLSIDGKLRLIVNTANLSKGFIWVLQPKENIDNYDLANYSLNGSDPSLKSKIEFNERDRENVKDQQCYNLVVPYYISRNIPEFINIYSFCLNLFKLQPSGAANLGRLNNVYIETELTAAAKAYINNGGQFIFSMYSIGYNVLRFMSGMSGIAFYDK